MNQPEYLWFSYATSIYIIILDCVLFLVLWKRGCAVGGIHKEFRQMDSGKKIMTVCAGVFLLIANVGLAFWEYCPSGFRYLASAILILGYSFLMDRTKMGNTIFVLSLFYNFHSLSFLISSGIYQTISDALIWNLDFEQMDYLVRLNQRLILGQVILLILYTLCFSIMIVILNRILHKGLSLNWQDVLFLSVLNVVGALLAGMVLDLSQVKLEHGVFLLYNDRKEMLWKIPLLAVLLYAGEISAIYIFQKYVELQKEKEKHFIEEQQVKAMKQRLEEAEQFYGSIRRVRHEMKNHMTNIKGLVVGEQYEEVEHYITRLDDTIQELDYKYMTGNPVTDVIINDKYRKAQSLGIAFTVDFSYVESDRIPVFDIGIILNNLLDNALEASEKINREERYINLSLKRKKAFLLIGVENGFDGRVLYDDREESNLPKTTKKCLMPDRMPEHGLGLKNVKEVAERYLGGVSINVEGKVFRVTVMLQQL